MRIAAIVLVHDQPVVAEQLVDVLLSGGLDVVVHVDRKVGRQFAERLASPFRNRRLAFAKRVNVEWGKFSIVRATLNGLLRIEELGWRPDYVVLMSGSDFPIRSADSLRSFLVAHSGMDFIESVPVGTRWVRGGLQRERFEYFFFVNWQRRRSLFNLAYRLQKMAARILGTRRLPTGVAPHLGSQWWALRWSTCTAILDLVRTRHRLVGFFRSTWIPDESFFQTLVRMVEDVRVIESNLTYFEFDELGRPLMLYDDHIPHLTEQPFFFARKFSPRAGRLREAMTARWLGPASGPILPPSRTPTRTFEDFGRLDRFGHRGTPRAGMVYHHGLGALDWNVRRYVVLLAPPAWQTNALAALLNECTPVRLCGRLYGRGFPEFHPQLERATRHLSDLSALRKLDPIGYWYEILSLAGEQPTGFVLGREDAPELWDAVLRDANAVKIVFKPHPTDVWHCMQAELLCRPTDEQQDYLDRAMHLSWNHEAGRRGSGIVHAIECYPWQLAPDASSVGRVITDLGGVAPDPDVVERRLSYSPGPSSLAARA